MAKTRGTGLLMLWTDVDAEHEAEFSPWRQKTSGGHVGRNYILNAYRQIFPARTSPIEATAGPAPALRMGRMDVPAAMDEEFNDWYNTAYIPELRRVPGALGARRYVAVDGQPKYLTVHEVENPGVPDSEPWVRARSANPWTARVFPTIRFDEGCPATYRRIFPK